MRTFPGCLLTVLAPAILLLVSCRPEIDPTITGECTDPTRRDEAHFHGHMVPDFFGPYCGECHGADQQDSDRAGAPAAVTTDDFASARDWAGVIWARVIDWTMPPTGVNPTEDEIEVLRQWVNCMAQVDTELPEDLGTCPTGSTVTWTDVEPIFSANCTRCHSSTLTGDDRNGAPEGVHFDSAADARRPTGEDRDYAYERIRLGEMPDDGATAGYVPTDEALLLWEWWSCQGPE